MVTKKHDAVALLKDDHRQVKAWFIAFAKSRTSKIKQSLATRICNALRVHTQIEEEIFYPAFFDATRDKAVHHEAVVEHASAKSLIDEIERSTPSDDYFDAKVQVLSEMIAHHVKEEEQPGGMFAEARQSAMDMVSLGQRLFDRKSALMTALERGQKHGSRLAAA